MDDPLVTFYRILPAGYPWREPDHGKPRRAQPYGVGLMPHRQAQYCEPSRTVTAFGYYVCLPRSFSVIWKGGREYQYSMDPQAEEATWYHLTAVQYPNSFRAWDAAAPPNCQGFCPPFLHANSDESLQIWSGWFARTRPGYSLWIGPPINLQGSPHYEILSGAVETDTWFGPLFTNLRFRITGEPVRFDAQLPFLQVIPYERATFGQDLDKFVVADGIPPELYPAYYETLVKQRDRPGHYAVLSRQTTRRAAREMSKKEA